MTEKTKKPENLFLWLEEYRAFAAAAEKRGMHVSDLLEEIINDFQDPNDFPKKGRTLNMTEETDLKLKAIADKWFKASQKTTGNKSDAVYYLIKEYLKNNKE
jgi:hypothetical protein